MLYEKLENLISLEFMNYFKELSEKLEEHKILPHLNAIDDNEFFIDMWMEGGSIGEISNNGRCDFHYFFLNDDDPDIQSLLINIEQICQETREKYHPLIHYIETGEIQPNCNSKQEYNKAPNPLEGGMSMS